MNNNNLKVTSLAKKYVKTQIRSNDKEKLKKLSLLFAIKMNNSEIRVVKKEIGAKIFLNFNLKNFKLLKHNVIANIKNIIKK